MAVKLDPIELGNMTSGVNQFTPASSLSEGEVSMAVNFKPRLAGRPRIRSRGGLRKLFTFFNPNGAAENVRGMKAALRNGHKGLLVLGQKNASWYPGDYANPIALGTIGPSLDTDPWSVAAWNEAVFAARRADGLRLVNLFPDTLGDGGVEAPTGALTATALGGGDLTAGDYYWTYAFYDPRLGTTSSRSPASNVLSLSSGEQGVLTGFDAPPEARFTQYKIFRSFPDATDAEYLTEIVDVADAEGHLDNIAIEAQGERSAIDNDAPPDEVHTVVTWNGRLWLLTDALLCPSKIQNPEAFPLAQALRVGEDATEANIDMVATKQRLVVGKRKSIWTVTGTGATSWAIRPLDLLHGVSAARSMVEHGGAIIWQSDDDYYVSDGVNPGVPLSGAGLRKLDPFFKSRVPGTPNVSASVPGSDGVLLGLTSRVVTRELED